jgi:signal transduction histidine kinase
VSFGQKAAFATGSRSCDSIAPGREAASHVSVTDCGIGISDENADQLFNTFFTTKSIGIGMGLSICRSIIEAHGGRLWSTANLPHGATFQFKLPVKLPVNTAS